MTKKLTITRKQAVTECKKLWKEIEESGLNKSDFLWTKAGEKWRAKNYHSNCPLCAYEMQFLEDCSHCPLVVKYGQACTALGYSSLSTTSEWFAVINGL